MTLASDGPAGCSEGGGCARTRMVVNARVAGGAVRSGDRQGRAGQGRAGQGRAGQGRVRGVPTSDAPFQAYRWNCAPSSSFHTETRAVAVTYSPCAIAEAVTVSTVDSQSNTYVRGDFGDHEGVLCVCMRAPKIGRVL
jgi:hypothetical protein